MRAYWVDIVAVAFFVAEWLAYGLTLEHSAYGRDSLSALMNRYREVWIRNMLDREARMVDMQIMAVAGDDGARRGRDVATAVRLERVAGDGNSAGLIDA